MLLFGSAPDQTLYKQGQDKVSLDTWLRPDSPQQSGFDAVMLLSNGLIHPNASCTGARFGDVGTGLLG
jgi:hypothetical protein